MRDRPITKRTAAHRIGNAGCVALGNAARKGALPKIESLFLGSNSIGDLGMTTIAGAISAGALPSLNVIHMQKNDASPPSKQALQDACVAAAHGERYASSHMQMSAVVSQKTLSTTDVPPPYTMPP